MHTDRLVIGQLIILMISGSAEAVKDAWASYNLSRRILTAVGMEEAQHKTVVPTTRMEFLGNTVDTV